MESKFDPKKYLIKIKGKDYLEVKFRLHWFRQEKLEWDIKTEIVKLDLLRGIAVVRADIYNENDIHKSSGFKMENQESFPDYLEKAETGAIGRALSALGYGTIQCFDLDEGIEEGRICDSPLDKKQYVNRENTQRQQNFSDNQLSPQKSNNFISEKQEFLVKKLLKEKNIEGIEIQKLILKTTNRTAAIEGLNKREASQVIEYLKNYEPAGSPLSENLYDDFEKDYEGGFVKLIPAGQIPKKMEDFGEPPPEEPPF